jgi:aminopeptidase N
MIRQGLGLSVVLFGHLLVSAQAPPATAPVPTSVEPLRYAADRPIDIEHIRLELKVDVPAKTVDALATLSFSALRPLTGFSLDAVEFEVKSVKLDHAGAKEPTALSFRHDGKKLAVELTGDWPTGKVGKLLVQYRVRQPRDGLFFFGPAPSEPNVPYMVWSQGEAITNRFWFPCNDNPVQRQTTETIVTVADGFEVLSNGKLLEKKTNADKTVTFHWKQSQSHVSYLVTLVIGKFDIVEEKWNGLPVSYYVPKGQKETINRTFGRTREMLDFFSRRFGIDYPWEKYAQVVVEQFTSGGMENTSATTLTQWTLHDERAMLDSSPDGLIAHELGHQWWGDLVTCKDWAHLWLNEGFASYCEVLWDEHKLGADEAAYLLVGKAKSAIAGGKERPIVDRRYPAPRLMFDARAYPKGAWVLNMLRKQLGEETFWKAIRTYGSTHKFQTVETSDFRKTLESVSGRNLEKFFYDWTERPGHPVLSVQSSYLADDKLVKLVVKQTQAGEPFHFPLTVLLERGSPTSAQVVDLKITERETTLFVPVSGKPSGLVIDPTQAVLAEISEEKGRDWWLHQLTASGSLAARVRAAEHFGKSKRPDDREALIKAFTDEKFWGVQVELVQALGVSGGTVCRDALLAGLQAKHPKVRRACVSNLAKFPKDAKVETALKELLKAGDAAYGVEAAALTAYPKLQAKDAVSVLLPWLVKPSHNDILASSAVTALGDAQDLAALDALVQATQRSKPRSVRIAAFGALAALAKTANPNEAQRKDIVTAVAKGLEGEMPLIRRAAVTALRELGRSAVTTVDALEAIAAHDPDDRIAALAKQAIEQVRKDVPAPVEVGRLREELERLRKLNETLQERFDKLEGKSQRP